MVLGMLRGMYDLGVFYNIMHTAYTFSYCSIQYSYKYISIQHRYQSLGENTHDSRVACVCLPQATIGASSGCCITVLFSTSQTQRTLASSKLQHWTAFAFFGLHKSQAYYSVRSGKHDIPDWTIRVDLLAERSLRSGTSDFTAGGNTILGARGCHAEAPKQSEVAPRANQSEWLMAGRAVLHCYC